ncbi:MAG TPA: polysaccharide biosynthesis tyrosine autokinase [Leucothrix sp.]|nr:polysaccharide biosynthesis tyrosine autokinase [Leucothrix sp.]
MTAQIQKNMPQLAEEDDVNLTNLIHTVLEGKWPILFFLLSFFTLAFIYAYGKTPTYQADALLQVEKKKGGVPGLEDLAGLSLEDATVGTELELIRSRKILGQAVEALKLDIIAAPRKFPLISNVYRKFFRAGNAGNYDKLPSVWSKFDNYTHKFAWGDERIRIESLKLPKKLRNLPLTLVAGEKNSFKILDADENLLLTGKVGSPSMSKNRDIKIFVSELKALSGTQFIIEKMSKLIAIEALQKKLQAEEKGKKTGIMQLVLEGPDKKVISQILNHISQTYLEQNKSRSSEEASNALGFLEEQVGPVKSYLEKAEARLKQYRIENKTADLSLETSAVLNVVSTLDTELQKLSLKKDELKQRYTNNHPTIQAIVSQERQLNKRKQATLAKIERLPNKQQHLLKFERDFKVASSIYNDVLNNIQEFKIAKASSVGNVYIVDSAVTHDKAIKPKKSLIIAIGTLLGGIFGVGLVFLRKMLRNTVDDPEVLERKTGIPVYASIPLSKSVTLTSRLSNKDRRQKSLLALEDSSDLTIESLRSLRTSLHFALLEAKNNIVMITGPSPNTGKSFISSNFAAVLATAEQRVLLIDADMRKGYLHNVLDLEMSPGLSEMISGKVAIEDAIHTIQISDHCLDVITRGQTPPNPSELLMHSNFEELLTSLSGQYDLILIDTPPIHAVTDPAIIGSHAGVVFMVAYAGLHPMREIEHAVARLAQTGIETKGFIFNGYVPKKNGYNYGYGYYYYYSD